MGHHPPGDSIDFDAPLADSDRLWPEGVVEYQFYHTFPAKNKRIVRQAMDYITSKVPCITFRPKIESARDFVTIYDGADSCSSEIGRVGGEQVLNLNRQAKVAKITRVTLIVAVGVSILV